MPRAVQFSICPGVGCIRKSNNAPKVGFRGKDMFRVTQLSLREFTISRIPPGRRGSVVRRGPRAPEAARSAHSTPTAGSRSEESRLRVTRVPEPNQRPHPRLLCHVPAENGCARARSRAVSAVTPAWLGKNGGGPGRCEERVRYRRFGKG